MKVLIFRAMILVVGTILGTTPTSATPNLSDYQQVTLGLCEDYPKATRTVEHARRDLKTAHDAGAKTLRIAFSWLDMEPEKGRYDFTFWDDFVQMATSEYGLQLIPYVCYTPEWASSESGTNAWKAPPRDPQLFARFVSVLVTRYKDRIHSWELWNEPDNADFWTGSGKQYAALVKAGSKAVRAADPSAKVVLGGLAWNIDFLVELFRDDEISSAVDVVNLHAYFETWNSQPLESLPAYINRAAAVIARYGNGQKLWLAEIGYSSFRRADGYVSADYTARNDYEHTTSFQGDALLRSITLALSTGKVSLVAWYRINDLPPDSDVIGDINNCHLGLMDSHGNPNPALADFRRATEIFADPLHPIPVAISEKTSAQAFAFQPKNRTAFVVTWIPASIPETGRKKNGLKSLTISLPLHGPLHFSESEGKNPSSSLIGPQVGNEIISLHLKADREQTKIYELPK